MNERIAELWDKAAESTMDQSWESQTKFMERFAELIVRECAAQCWTVSELESRGFVVSECTKRMRKHFGVE